MSKLKKEKKQIMKSKIYLGIYTWKENDWLEEKDQQRLKEIDDEIAELNKPGMNKIISFNEIVPKNKKPKITWNVFMVLVIIS